MNDSSLPELPYQKKLRAGNLAIWNASQKYLGAICAAIFAIVLSQPELAKETYVLGRPIHIFIEWYLIFGLFGIYGAELKRAYEAETNTTNPPFPIRVRVCFTLYTFVGMLIFARLLHELMTR